LDILSEIAPVSLVSANVSDSSEIRDDHEVIEVSTSGTGSSILVAGFRFLLNQFRMCRVIAKRDEEIIWFFGATSYLLPILFAKLLGKTVILHPRGDVPLTLQIQWEERVPVPIARFLAGSVRVLENTGYWLADAIVTYTPSMATELGLDRYGSKLHTNGARYVDLDSFTPQAAYQERQNVVGFLGRLDEEKRIHELATVAKQLPDDVTFVFAGDGPLHDWLVDELSAEIESGSVEMLGWVEREDVPEVLNRFRLLVLPSEMEGLPTVILEAFGCGTPVYATPVSGVPDVVVENETGFLIEDVDSEVMASEISAILERDDLAEMSKNVRRTAEDEYGFDAAVTRYEQILSPYLEQNKLIR
jgi:glycosyltransferase involved in cell wall biosynthesis